MRTQRWLDWLHAQAHWAALYKAGYRHHTPESIFLCLNRHTLELVVRWTV